MNKDGPKSERRALDTFIRSGTLETRDLETGTPQLTQTASVLVQAAFLKSLLKAMRKYDELFDPSVTNFVTYSNGSQMVIPTIDDTGNAATVVAEGAQDTETDPTLGGVLVPIASNYRTGMVKLSLEFLQDSAFDPTDFLAKSFAIRLARGIGAGIVTTALAGAQSGATAGGNSTVSPDDVLALLKSVDPAYLEGPKSGLAMSYATLLSILGTQASTNQYILPPDWDGKIFGLPVFVSPSMPAIGSQAKPVLAGDFGYVAVRIVEGGTNLARYDELYATTGQVGFRGFLRASSAVGIAPALKYLQQPT